MDPENRNHTRNQAVIKREHSRSDFRNYAPPKHHKKGGLERCVMAQYLKGNEKMKEIQKRAKAVMVGRKICR
jgi:hypothetical protein